MSAQVTVVDYGSGNLLSVSRGLEHCGGAVEVTGDRRKIAAAERLVLPGVGAFGKAADRLRGLGLADAIIEFLRSERPFLGICVGMQLMLDRGEEFGDHDGLGLIAGRVTAVPETTATGARHPVPHIGWSPLQSAGTDWSDTALRETRNDDSVYFVHSFMAVPDDPAHVLATCDYNGRSITAAIAKGNAIGCQFHPEKSGPVGLTILQRFLGVA